MAAAVDYSYVGGGEAEFKGSKTGDSQAQSANVMMAGAVPLSQRWFVPLGLGSGNFFLDSVTGMPIPDQIHTLRLHTGLGYQLNEQWTLMAGVGPALYRYDHVSSDDFGIAGMVSAIYQVRPDLTLAFGIGVNPDSSIPVLPAAGVRWDIQTNLTLNLMFPRPVLLYRVAPKLSVFAGGDIKLAVFRADTDQGDQIGLRQYNNALGTYRDFHLGAGAEYEIVRGLSVAVEGGYSVGREIDYKRVGETVKFDPAPYGQVGVKYRF
jgi:opacity protein-like surface antigen